MKHLIRKPLLPILLLAVMAFASCFLTFFQDGIRRDRAQVEGLYDNTIITIELLSGDESAGQLQLPTHKGDFLKAIEQVSKILCVMECDAQLEDTYTRIYGTNDYAWLARHQDLNVQLWDGWDWTAFSETDGVIPCIVGANIRYSFGVSLGDTVTIIPMDYRGTYSDKAPEVTMVIAGFFSDPTYAMDGGIIVPEEIFLYGPKLLYNSQMMYDCFYRTCLLELDPAYNRDYEAVEEAIDEVLFDVKYELVSNFRTLRRAVGPLERKLAVQERLVLPLGVLFAMAAMTCMALLAKSFETESFLRLIWGEKRIGVFGKLMGAMILWLAGCGILSAVTAGVAAGGDWFAWAAGYAGTVSLLCAVAAAVSMGWSCGRNLVKFYQSKEGE